MLSIVGWVSRPFRNQPFDGILKPNKCFDQEAPVLSAKREEGGFVESFTRAQNRRFSREGLIELAELGRQIPKVGNRHARLRLAGVQKYFIIAQLRRGGRDFLKQLARLLTIEFPLGGHDDKVARANNFDVRLHTLSRCPGCSSNFPTGGYYPIFNESRHTTFHQDLFLELRVTLPFLELNPFWAQQTTR